LPIGLQWYKALEMKYLARLEKDQQSKIISIYHVIRGLNGENPSQWERRTYYSLWKLNPMIAKVYSNKQNPHFAFKKGFGGNENSGGGESIEHQLSKEIISDLKTIHIKMGEISGKLYFSEILIEKPFENGKYEADLYCKISNENNFNFPIGSMLVIEFHKTNRVKKSKEKFYRDHNLAAIEIDVWDKIKFQGNIEKLQNQLKGYFQKPRFAKRLHDPNWKKIKAQRERKKEIQQQKEVEISEQIIKKHERQKNEFLELERQELLRNQEKKVNQQGIQTTTKQNKKSIWRRIIDFIMK